MFGEKTLAAGGLSEMMEDRKMLRAPPKVLLRPPEGASSLVRSVLRVWGVGARLAKLPYGEAPTLRCENARGAFDLGVELAGSATSSPGNAKVTISRVGQEEFDSSRNEVMVLVRRDDARA